MFEKYQPPSTESYVQLVDTVSMQLLSEHPTTQITLQTDICFAEVLEQMPCFKVD